MIHLIHGRGFSEGLLTSALACGLVLLVGMFTVRGRASVAGVPFVVACIVTFEGFGPFAEIARVPTRVLIGLAALVAGGLAVRLAALPFGGAVLLFLPGGLVLGYGTGLAAPGWPAWVQPLVAIGTAVGGALVADTDRARRHVSLGPILLAVAIAGVAATVPDTEHIAVLLGAAVPLLVWAFPMPVASLGPEGAAAATGLLLWVAAIDGRGRPGSIVGALGCLGLLLVEPIGRRLAPSLDPRRHVRPPHSAGEVLAMVALFVGLQLVLTGYASRIAGFERTGRNAALLLVPAAIVAVVVACGLPPPPRAVKRV
ncbi:MAG: hypothetical protein JWL83_4158 [Actinomycetia bacterium]|nr:hypothetical protein [Actinomycetes bacterium]